MEPCPRLLAKAMGALREKVRVQQAPSNTLYESLRHDYECNSAKDGCYAADRKTKEADVDMPQTRRPFQVIPLMSSAIMKQEPWGIIKYSLPLT